MSVSQYKDFLKCEKSAMAKINGDYVEEKTTALLVGSYVDAYVEGTLDKFKEENPEIFNSRTGELKSDYKGANKMIKKFTNDEFFMSFLQGEKQKIFTAEFFNCKWKSKIDILSDDKIVDFKTTKNFERVYGVSFIEHWGYDKQLAIYQELVRLSTGKRLPVYIAAITKEKEPDLAIINIPQIRLNECLEEIEKDMIRINAVKNGEIKPYDCGVCNYCKKTKKLDKVIDYTMVGFDNNYIKEMELV